jgi:hypothetical protein
MFRGAVNRPTPPWVAAAPRFLDEIVISAAASTQRPCMSRYHSVSTESAWVAIERWFHSGTDDRYRRHFICHARIRQRRPRTKSPALRGRGGHLDDRTCRRSSV